MAARTASVSGDWSNTATWGGAAVPVNGDTFTINSGVVVDFDVDQSAMPAGMGASTINGTLRAKRAAGTYYLKMAASLTVSTTGTLDASDGSGGAYRSDATVTLQFATGFGVIGAGSAVANLICGEPTHKYVSLSQAESSAATTIHVDTDLTGDPLWAVGALIRIDNVANAAQSEERTISSVTSTTIVLTAGLTNSKLIASRVILVSRNVKVIGGSSISGTGITTFTASPIIGAEIRVFGTGCGANTGAVINGSITNCTTGVGSSSMANTVNAPISGCTTGVSGGVGGGWAHTLSGLISGCTAAASSQQGVVFNGIISGCNRGLDTVQGGRITGTISGCAVGILNGSGFALVGATLQNNTLDIASSGSFQGFNTLLGSSVEFSGYNGAGRGIADYAESIDHDQTAGAFRAWTKGGITSSTTGTVYGASRPRSYNTVCESASYPAFFQRSVLVPAGGALHVRCYVRKDASMSYLPRVQVFSADKEPLISGSPDAEVTMTNSVDTWEVLETSVVNTGDTHKLYIVRMLAKNASGSVYFDPIIRTSGFVTQREAA